MVTLLEQEENNNCLHNYFNGFFRIEFIFTEIFKVGERDHTIHLSSWWGYNPFNIGIKNFQQKKEELLKNSKDQSPEIKIKIQKIIDDAEGISNQYNIFKDKYGKKYDN